MSLKAQYEFLVFLLLAILVLELVARRMKLPPAASFIAGGMALAFIPGAPKVEVNPELILVVFLPPLLMSSAYFTIWSDFKKTDSWDFLARVWSRDFHNSIREVVRARGRQVDGLHGRKCRCRLL